MNNVTFSAVNKRMEHFAIPMFTSFIKFNPNIPMYCVVTDDVSDLILIYLEHLGVNLIKYRPELTTAKTPAKALMHLTLVITDYIPNFDKVLLLDVDMLIFDKILELLDYSTDIVAHGGFDGENWIENTKTKELYVAFGTSVISHEASCRLRDLYKKHGESTGDNGDFIRKHLSDFTVQKIATPIYYFGNKLIENAKYCEYSKRITYTYKNEHYIPKIIHFTKYWGGKWDGRGRSVVIDKWCLDNGVQLRHETSGGEVDTQTTK